MEPRRMAQRPGGMLRMNRLALAIVMLLALAACNQGSGGSPNPSSHPASADEAVRLTLAQQPRFAGIGPYDANAIGQAAWYKVATSGAGWQVEVRIGWGDCEAGCISEHRWIYAVGRDGKVELTSQKGDPLPDASGVHGTVTAGPTCPVETQPPQPGCEERPVAGAVLVFTDGSGTEVARVTSNADGTYAVELPPGAYRVTPQPVKGLMGTPAPMDVVVDAGGPMTELPVSYDTGIR